MAILSVSLLALLMVIGVIIFNIIATDHQKNITHYNELIEQAFSMHGTSTDDFIAKRNLLFKAQEMENEIPVAQRKDISGTLFQLNLTLDSIYFKNLEDARWFAKVETKHGINQAMECYKLALQVKEDPVVRGELNAIFSKKGIYE